MPAPRVRDEWEPLIKQIAADNPRWGAERVRNRLEQQVESLERELEWEIPSLPSISTIKRILSDFPDSERAEYGRFRWPESMERIALPWEASQAALELLAILDRQQHYERPPIRIVRWWWRVSMAAPTAPVNDRFWTALTFATYEALGREDEVRKRGFEWYFAYRPWEPESKEAYERALARQDSPISKAKAGIALPMGDRETERFPAAAADIQWALGFAFRGVTPTKKGQGTNGQAEV